MKIPIFNYIHKAIKALDYTHNRFNLFGSGAGGSIHFAYPTGGTGTSEQYFINSLTDIPVLEYENITIDKDVNVTAFNPSLGITNTPFYLKVNGTLTVNGHLNMDNCGAPTLLNNDGFIGSYVTDYTSRSKITCYLKDNAQNHIEGNKLPIIRGYEGQNHSCSESTYAILKSYGSTPTFFNFKVAATGCGHIWLTGGPVSGGYFTQSLSPISASKKSIGVGGGFGGGGGFLTLYYKNMQNSGPTWVDNQPGSSYLGQVFPKNIHCNGVAGGNWASSQGVPVNAVAGGGMLVIAARNIVIGQYGKITCDSYFKEDPHPQMGQFALLNRLPIPGMVFMTGNLETEDPFNSEGGGGVCLGFKR